MKQLKINLGLFSLLALLSISVILTSCEKEALISEQTENLEVNENESTTFIIAVPKGLTEEAAVEWAREQPIDQFREISGEEGATIVESRWCTSYSGPGFLGNVCICQGAGPSQGQAHCMNYCQSITTRYCGGWSGGRYVVTSQITSSSDCYC